MTVISTETVSALLGDAIIVRIVTVLDISSLSILELLEYDISRSDINHALANDVVEIDKSAPPATKETTADPTVENLLVSGDVYYYRFLNSKVHLTELGKYLLSSLNSQPDQQTLDRARQMFNSEAFNPPESPQRPI